MAEKVYVQVVFEMEPELDFYPQEYQTPKKAAEFDLEQIEDGHGDIGILIEQNVVQMKVLDVPPDGI